MILVGIAVDAALAYFLGWKSLVYLLGGSLLCMGLHPMAGHIISEHYLWDKVRDC